MAIDFLVMGATRCGTSWLHQQLRRHPQVWLPPQKEIHYFTEQRIDGLFSRKHRRHLKTWSADLRAALRGPRGPLAELAWQLRYQLGRRSDRWLRALWRTPEGLLGGMIEPTYATLPAGVIERIRELAPGARLVYLMRDPIDRSWSSATKSRARNLDRSMTEVPTREIFEKLHRSALRMSAYADHLERWRRVWPEAPLLVGFFEEVDAHPRAFLDRVCAFLGIAPLALPDAELDMPVNHTRGFRATLPLEVERYLAEQLIEPTRRLAAVVPGPPEQWLARMESLAA